MVTLDGKTPDQGLAGRRFVLLQGPSSRFFAHLGRALRAAGAEVLRVGFCPGDRLFWSRSAGAYVPFRGDIEDFGDWLAYLLAKHGATDLIMLGDGRAPHQRAIAQVTADGRKVRIWIVEHGYLRPDLILIEPDGMGGASTIPGRPVPTPATQGAASAAGWPSSFLRYAAMDVAYHVSNLLAAWATYPQYRAHSGIHPLAEYGGWLRKFATAPRRRTARCAAEAAIAAHRGPIFLVPLQLSQDTQLVRYGTGETQTATLDRVLQSFAAHAPADALLVVKVHPLDNGLTDWPARLDGVTGRAVYLDGGDLDAILRRAAGVVTVNSTVGLTALRMGVPVLALGQAIYRAAGLTDDRPLDAFWRGPEPVDAGRVAAFCAYLAQDFHVRGAFDGPGAVAGARALAGWLAAPPPDAMAEAEAG